MENPQKKGVERMKKKTLFILLLTVMLCISFLIPSAWAGSKQRHRWEGAGIGIGAAILGSVLLKHYHKYYSPNKHAPAPVYSYPATRHHRHRGHWEAGKEWVPPTYKRVWNPGHYNRRGQWVAGHWIKILEQPGYWTKTHVWVSCR